MNLNLKTPFSQLNSVGPKREKDLGKLNIKIAEDLLFFYPRRYLDLRNFKKISALIPYEMASIKGKVLGREERRVRGRVSYLKVIISDNTGFIPVMFFNQPYLKDVFQVGKEFFLHGKVGVYKGVAQMSNPLYEEEQPGRRDWLLPLYSLSGGLTQKYMRKLVKLVLSTLDDEIVEMFSLKERQELGLTSIRFALQNIHFPLSDMNLEKARSYLIFREFFILQLNLLINKKAEQALPAGSFTVIEKKSIKKFESLLPFKLTKSQKIVMEEIVSDINQGKSIRRLIHGEVGSGKTVVAIFALWLFAKQGYQSAFLAPTEILAEQHYLNWQDFFMKENLSVAILLGQMSEKEKRNVRDQLNNGEINVVIGTHSIITEKLSFKNLKMVVVDEQHKFGVEQREVLKQKGDNPHYIVMSATPIPRSVAMTFYGALDISTIGELPKGERKVATYLFQKDEKEKIYQFLEYQSSEGKQGYVVTPAIDTKEDIESAVKEYERIKRRLPSTSISLIHGKIPYQEKEEIMKNFRAGKTSILVSTTVIESGIDVPEASYIIIEQAERFGLAQLHQLRGRVGRSGDTGYCMLISYTQQDEIMERLENFATSQSGFEIAEIDLKIRGQGDLMGTRQHGIPPLKIGNIVRDLEVLKIARLKAEELFETMPEEEIMKKFLIRSINEG
ncbi:ATP-dependent DNA helicase RecG [bacterium]|nr:ATP-dependent DNA helicase RecG [bacterium]